MKIKVIEKMKLVTKDKKIEKGKIRKKQLENLVIMNVETTVNRGVQRDRHQTGTIEGSEDHQIEELQKTEMVTGIIEIIIIIGLLPEVVPDNNRDNQICGVHSVIRTHINWMSATHTTIYAPFAKRKDTYPMDVLKELHQDKEMNEDNDPIVLYVRNQAMPVRIVPGGRITGRNLKGIDSPRTLRKVKEKI